MAAMQLCWLAYARIPEYKIICHYQYHSMPQQGSGFPSKINRTVPRI